MAHLVHRALWSVVLDVHGRHVASGRSSEPLARQALELDRTLEHHDIDVEVLRGRGRDLVYRRGPRIRLGAATAVRRSIGQHGHEVFVTTLDERGGPRAVHMPHEDPHATAVRCTSASTASTTSAGVIARKHRCSPKGHTRARHSRHSISCSPSSTYGTIHGCQRDAGTVGGKIETTGVPTLAARWAGPVLPTTTASACCNRHARASTPVSPPRSTTDAGRPPAT